MRNKLFAAGIAVLAATLAPHVMASTILVGHGPMQYPADPRMFISNAEIQARIAQIEADVKAGKPYSGEPLVMQGPFRATMEWRNTAQNSINVHLDDGEFFIILKGSGEMTLGGTLVDPKVAHSFPWEGPTLSAKSAIGAKIYPVKEGDMIMIPPNTPHTVSEVNGELVSLSLHLPMDSAHAASPEKPGDPKFTTAR